MPLGCRGSSVIRASDTEPSGLCSPQTLLKSGEQCWSLAELVQAVVILAHCHSLCSFVFGSGTDSDCVPLSKSPNGTPPTLCPFDAANGNTNVPLSLATPSEHMTRRRVTLQDFTFTKVRDQTVGCINTHPVLLLRICYAKKLSKCFCFGYLMVYLNVICFNLKICCRNGYEDVRSRIRKSNGFSCVIWNRWAKTSTKIVVNNLLHWRKVERRRKMGDAYISWSLSDTKISPVTSSVLCLAFVLIVPGLQ